MTTERYGTGFSPAVMKAMDAYLAEVDAQETERQCRMYPATTPATEMECAVYHSRCVALFGEQKSQSKR
jgi:hypothetical protein